MAGPSGNIAAEVPINGGFATAWARLYQALKDALPGECCCFNRTLVRIDERADGVTAIFAIMVFIRFGFYRLPQMGSISTVRRQLLPEIVPRYAGYVCWRGVVEEADTPLECSITFIRSCGFLLSRRRAFSRDT